MRRSRAAARKPATACAALGLLAVAVWLPAHGGPARADFVDALAAYDAGDYATAFEEWRALAEAGDPVAQVALGELYLHGQGVPADSGAAIRWYRRAAEAGDPVAQLNLGEFYSRGLGVPCDLVEAHVWLSLAASQGRAWAERRREEIARAMTAAQLTEAEARVASRRP